MEPEPMEVIPHVAHSAEAIERGCSFEAAPALLVCANTSRLSGSLAHRGAALEGGL
jgi:hypothetical protein